ncbi:MAG: acyltransferase [Chitinophagaceae bacterium]|nr:acyltransferase [Chitinophagaceae bacterium]
MDRKKFLNEDPDVLEFFEKLEKLYVKLGIGILEEFKRLPSFPDMLVDRWKRAELLGFGEGSNIYDNALVLGNVKVGKECWIGPNTILDGSGGLIIGDYCTISAGAHIYSHDNVKQTLSSKKQPIDKKETKIGNNVYVAPNVVIAKGVTIGNNCVIATASFVNKIFPDNCIIMGQPAKVVGKVENTDDNINFIYS